MSTLLNFQRDINGYNAYAPAPSTDNFSSTLASGTAASITVPSNFDTWVFVPSYQPGTDVWVDFTGATAAVPVGGTFASTTSVLNPGPRVVPKGTSISMITDSTTAEVGVSFYANINA